MAYDKFAAVDSSTLLFPPSVRENLAGSGNTIINGAFEINQRSFSSTTSSNTYGFDRWKLDTSGGTTYSAQTFTTGAAPVSGYEAKNYARLVTTGQSGASVFSIFRQFVEDVRTYAGQTVTISFWAKAASGTPKLAVEFTQSFGSGGSPSSAVDSYAGNVTLSTSWQRYSVTYTLPSIAGKTIGTADATSYLLTSLWVSAGTDFNARTGSIGIQSNTFDIWGVQLEAGAVATPFRRNANSLQGELAACQRYYYRTVALGNNAPLGYGAAQLAGTTRYYINVPVPLRAFPTALEWTGNGADYQQNTLSLGATKNNLSSIAIQSDWVSDRIVCVVCNTTGQTVDQILNLSSLSGVGYIGIVAEL